MWRPPPQQWSACRPASAPIVWQTGFSWGPYLGAFPVVLTIFIMAFVDTMGTLIGLSARAGFLDENGHLPQIERPMLVDAITTTLAPILGTTTSGAFIESATGIEAGGRTGLAPCWSPALLPAFAVLFLAFVAAIPAQAYGPALIIVGLFMLAPITRDRFRRLFGIGSGLRHRGADVPSPSTSPSASRRGSCFIRCASWWQAKRARSGPDCGC